MIERAIKKIKDEMSKTENVNIKRIGNFLLKQIEINKSAAEAIVKEGKSIEGSIKAMHDEIRKNPEKYRAGNFAMFPDEEGFSIVNKYFGIEGVQNKILKVKVYEIKQDNGIHSEEKPKKKRRLSLDEMMKEV